MADARAAILRGKREAARSHRAFGMRERIEADGGRIDVFDTIVRKGVPWHCQTNANQVAIAFLACS